ncbi:MarR family winged helix-turn-helix transcriptional regulator [Pseudodesulfovibrio sp. S3-i]|nr:MarR family transcriptional regulator [Pseudodesulfovibrio sp. S3-i]
MNIYHQLRRIIEKHTRMDEQPFQLDDSIALSPREVRTIEFLSQRGQINVTSVATHFNFTKSAASQLINRLVQRGLVCKENSEHSDKEYQLSLSPEGENAHRLIETMNRDRLDMYLGKMEGFSRQQIAATSAVLEQLEHMVDERLNRFK